MFPQLAALLLSTAPCQALDEEHPTIETCVAIAAEAEIKLPGFREEVEATVHALADCVRKVAAASQAPRPRKKAARGRAHRP